MLWIILSVIAAMGIFTCLNQYSAKNIRGVVNVLKFSIITIPLQIIGYTLLVYYFGEGFKRFSDNYWIVSLILTFVAYGLDLLIAYLWLHQVPVRGQAIGFVLMFIGAVIAVLWK